MTRLITHALPAALGACVALSLSAAPQTKLGSSGIIEHNARASFAGDDLVGKDGRLHRLGYDLTFIYEEHRNFNMQGGMSVLKRNFRSRLTHAPIKDEMVTIDTVAAGNVEVLRETLHMLGMKNIAESSRTISGRLPISSLSQLAVSPSLKLARPSYAITNTGSVTSQGDVAQASDTARTFQGLDGTGVTVGVLSDSYDCLGGAGADIISDDIQVDVNVLQEFTGCIGATDEGRAMIQIVHDVAPGASQAFHSAFNGLADFANGIVELATVAGADVITDDVIYFAEPMFQDGEIAQAADTVSALGVAYYSSAGNQAQKSYQEQFINSGIAGYYVGSVRHDFDISAATDVSQGVTIAGNTRVIIVLQWDDPFFSVSGASGADTDLDLFVYKANGTTVEASSIDSNIGGDPVEVLIFTTNPGPDATYHISIEHYSGPIPGTIKYVYYNNMTLLEYVTNSSTVYGHANAAGAIAVGAARYTQTPAFGVIPPNIESFSSSGNTPIIFDTSGSPINITRNKPEIVAPDGGDNTFFGFDYEDNTYPNFFGTSAAAPHAAGVAALFKQMDINMTPATITSAMISTAIDMDAAGFDYKTGYGLMQADAALAFIDVDADGVFNDDDNCPNVVNPLQDDYDNDGLGDACDEDDDNDELTDTEEITIYFTNPFNPDTDGDGLMDGEEISFGSDPNLVDSDSDSFDDLEEYNANSDPNNPNDIPGAGSGDINNDGNVDVVDTMLAMRIAIGAHTPSINERLRGDVAPLGNTDSLIRANDLLLIQRKAMGLTTY